MIILLHLLANFFFFTASCFSFTDTSPSSMRKFIIIHEMFPSPLYPLCCFFSSHRRILEVHRSLSVSCVHPHMYLYITGGSDSKKSAHKAGDPGLIPGLGRSPGEGNGNPPQYSCLGNPMNRGAWGATVHGVTKRWTRLSKDNNISTGGERQKVCVGGCLSCKKSKIQFYLYWSVPVWL